MTPPALTIITAVAVALLAAELKFQWRLLCRALLRLAVRRLPASHRERLYEEWSRHLLDLAEAPLSALVYALTRFREASEIRSELTSDAEGLRTTSRVAKRALDLTLVTVGLVAMSPVLALIAVVIKLDSPGPILYWQICFGPGDRSFAVPKFRTLHVGADRLPQPPAELAYTRWADRTHPQETRFGRILRRTSLDELPQLMNVIRGDMSLVGPRPMRPAIAELFAREGIEYPRVPPGLISPTVFADDIESHTDLVRREREYVEHRSFWRDLMTIAGAPARVARLMARYSRRESGER